MTAPRYLKPAEVAELATLFDLAVPDDYARRMRGQPFCYLIGHRGCVKIGFTRNLVQREQQFAHYLPGGCDLHGVLRGGTDIEKRLNAAFADYHVNDSWFERAGLLYDFTRCLEFFDWFGNPYRPCGRWAA